jgi:hypothetical protein
LRIAPRSRAPMRDFEPVKKPTTLPHHPTI